MHWGMNLVFAYSYILPTPPIVVNESAVLVLNKIACNESNYYSRHFSEMCYIVLFNNNKMGNNQKVICISANIVFFILNISDNNALV